MKLFDMHCDTPLELYRNGTSIRSNSLHVSLDKAADFEKYIQCAAIWSDSSLSDSDCLERFQKSAAYFKNQLGISGTPLIEGADKLNADRGFILTVEGARLICGELSNLDMLYDCGVRILTLVWKGEDSIGGAWDTDMGLTPLGRAVVEKCLDIGIIPDISHGSRKLSHEVIDMLKSADIPPLATHSNAVGAYKHPRNLDDDTVHRICDLGGICGISLCTDHLADSYPSFDDIFKHIDKYIDLGGAKNVCFGCDFDGIKKTPAGISDLSSMKSLYNEAVKKYGSTVTEDIFFNNAYNYMKRILPTK